MKHTITTMAALIAVLPTLPAVTAQAQPVPAAADADTDAGFKPTVEDWIGVNAAVNNYTLGLELKDMERFDAASWPEATITAVPEPGKSFTMPYKMAAEPPPAAPGAPPVNTIGNTNAPWHIALSHDFAFQSPTRATHYGYFVSLYPDLETKITTVGLPGHYEDVLQKRNNEWRIISRKTVIGEK